MLTEQQKKDCLNYDPFAGDFGDGVKKISDKLVKGRTVTKCTECKELTEAKTNHRVITEIVDGEMRSYRFCEKCCVAMAEYWNGNYEPIAERIKMGQNAPNIAKEWGLEG